MGIHQWWQARRAKQEKLRQSLALNEDQRSIAAAVPELVGMDFVKGGAYVLKALEEFSASCSKEQSLELASRLVASQESWKAEGLTMPYWGNLIVLRRLQAEIAPETTKPP